MKKPGLLFVLVLLFPLKMLAQQVVPAWGGGADQRDLSFGFTFQYVGNDFKIVKNPNWRDPYIDPKTGQQAVGSLIGISSKSSPGLAIGFITRYSISEHVEVRTTPLLVFADRTLEYTYASANDNPASLGTNVVERPVQTTSVEVPLLLKLKSDRLGNFRAYAIGGIQYTGQISAKKAVSNISPADMVVKNTSHFASYVAGVGCDIYFEFFKFSPEIRITNSLGNVIVADNSPYSKPIDKLFVHSLRLSLYFE